MCPQVAAAASWMESFKMPVREIRRKYTKSELAVMAWRSGEIAANMDVSHRTQANDTPTGRFDGKNTDPTDIQGRDLDALEERLGPIVVKLENEQGDVDLRRLTGDEAMRFMTAMGIPIGGRV